MYQFKFTLSCYVYCNPSNESGIDCPHIMFYSLDNICSNQQSIDQSNKYPITTTVSKSIHSTNNNFKQHNQLHTNHCTDPNDTDRTGDDLTLHTTLTIIVSITCGTLLILAIIILYCLKSHNAAKKVSNQTQTELGNVQTGIATHKQTSQQGAEFANMKINSISGDTQ